MTIVRKAESPRSFALLEELDSSGPVGIHRLAPGVFSIDWDQLALRSHLSSTERAMVHIARGMVDLEARGGAPYRLGVHVLVADDLFGARDHVPTVARS